MTTININTNKEGIQKDIEKGQKILAAIYMVTNHLPENDSIRHQLRNLGTTFICSPLHIAKELVVQMEIVLGGAALSGLISDKNSSIIVYEAKHFCQQRASNTIDEKLTELFSSNQLSPRTTQTSIKDIKRTSSSSLVLSSHRPLPSMSESKDSPKNVNNKSIRQDTILSFINDRKSAVIKDIILLFPDVSEKTIQRELNTLIDAGRIAKRGSKRWSIYMAVNSGL